MYECFPYVSNGSLCVCLVPVEVRSGHQIPQALHVVGKCSELHP